MFRSEGGAGVGGRTEKARPWAWLTLWYGSWPRMTTLTVFKGVWRDLCVSRYVSLFVLFTMAVGSFVEID